MTAKKPLMWPWGFCVWGWACNALTREGCGGKRQADRSCREALKHLKLRKTSSTPAVVPGATPALAKAGVGGFKAWQTAGLDAHKKPLMWPWGACWLRDGACQENV